MKNIFKFMGVALVACSLMVACGKDEEEPTDTTPVTPPTPTAGVKVVWDGVEQNLGFTDAYASTQAENVYWFEGAKGLVNEEYQYPAFFVAFMDGGSGFYPAFFYYSVDQNTGDTIRYNTLYPTEVYNEGGIEVQGELHGDYQLYGYNGNALPVMTWDANTKKLSCELSINFFDYVAATQGQTVIKTLDLTFTDYAFDAAK